MKKLMAGLFIASLASQAMATASFEFGSTWFFPRYDQYNDYNWSGQGQSFAANWDLDNDLIVGAYTESTDMTDGYSNTYVFQVNAISVSKGVVKNASIGLHLGTYYGSYNDYTGMLTDVVGSVTLMSGNADKVAGSLKANFGGRFARDNEGANTGAIDYSGYFVSLAVGIGI
jgi:hypothetical protein